MHLKKALINDIMRRKIVSHWTILHTFLLLPSYLPLFLYMALKIMLVHHAMALSDEITVIA